MRAVLVAVGLTVGCGALDDAEYDVSQTRTLHVRAVSPATGTSEGLDDWGSILPDVPADIDWPTDPLSEASRAYQQAVQDFREASPADRTTERLALHRTRDAVLRLDSLASDVSVERGATPWQAAIALHRLTERALDSRQLEDPEEVQHAATALLGAAPTHPASVHARLVLANLAAAPTLSTYDPEASLAWALDALEHDPLVVAEVARLLEVLPGDLPLPDWAYDLLRPQWQADADASLSDSAFDHAVRLGHVDDALREQQAVDAAFSPFCDLSDAHYVCEPFLDRVEANTARLMRLGWTTSDDWRVHAHAAVAECAEDLAIPGPFTLSWDGTWDLQDAPATVQGCVLAELAGAPSPDRALSVAVEVTN